MGSTNKPVGNDDPGKYPHPMKMSKPTGTLMLSRCKCTASFQWLREAARVFTNLDEHESQLAVYDLCFMGGVSLRTWSRHLYYQVESGRVRSSRVYQSICIRNQPAQARSGPR